MTQSKNCVIRRIKNSSIKFFYSSYFYYFSSINKNNMYGFKSPTTIKPGMQYTVSWANNPFLKFTLVDVTNNQAYLKNKSGKEFSTHVNNLRIPRT